MRLQNIELKNFRAIDDVELELNGKCTIFFGVNGTGKSSILRAINLLYANIINQIVNRSELKQNYTIQLQDIKYGKKETKISAGIQINEKLINYSRGMVRSTGKKSDDKDALKQIASVFHDSYIFDEEQNNIPIFVNYGTNRLVLDIPLRIRTHHNFDVYSAFEKAIENKIDFRTFFEWYRNQEDYENEQKIASGDLNYEDRSLKAVRTAILSMLDECSNLRVVRKPRIEMKIDKAGISLNVSQMSDGEKCTMALLGDLARRLAVANPHMDNPLLGEGIVLIDEIDLHMHPIWQRTILGRLRQVFPNIQFIITTHSPIILSEANEDFNIFYLQNENGSVEVEKKTVLTGYDTSAVLEQFMGTKSMNVEMSEFIHSIYRDIREKQFDTAENKIKRLEALTSSSHPDVVAASMELKIRRAK